MLHFMIRHAAPTLARLKTGSLINIPLREIEPRSWAKIEKNLSAPLAMTILRKRNDKVLVYLYNTCALSLLLKNPHAAALLKQYHYPLSSCHQALKHLSLRLTQDDFPHEIGLFLGYPIEDVLGFITHQGRHYLSKGYWKVYAHPDEKRALFKRFDRSKKYYLTLLNSGCRLSEILKPMRKGVLV